MRAEMSLRDGYWRGSQRLTPWQRHSAMLAGAMLLLFLMSWRDLADIVAIWSRTGAFHHCFLIPPVILWLVWQRRALLMRLTPEYALRGVALTALGALLWLAGEAGTVALFRQAGLVIAAQGIVIALLGIPIARALAFPLGFALFLIPVGTEFEPLLQIVTAHVAVALLHLIGTPALMEGVFIETPAGLFRVAEACSGTAFLLAMAAYAALVAQMCFRSWRRRMVFAAGAMTAAVLTNGVRAFAIMQVANWTSIHNPIVQDHLLYGWLLFAAVLLVLMMTASRWFDADPDASLPDAAMLQGVRRSPSRGWLVVPLLSAVLLLPRFWLFMAEPAETALTPPPIPPAVAGWRIMPGAPPDWRPHFVGATWIGQWRYTRAADGRTADLALVQFARQDQGHELVGFGQGAVAPEGDWAMMESAVSGEGGRGEWLRGPRNGLRYVVTYYLVGGHVTGSRTIAKLATAQTRLIGQGTGAAAILISVPGTGGDATRIAADFLHDAGSVQEMADRALTMG